MSDALLNLVRCATLDESEALDVESGSTVYTQHDEIQLADPDGNPCALPSQPTWIDSDVRYEYIGGGVGISARRARLQLAIALDYIGSEVHSKLQRWMHDRALLWFAPGFGRFTDFAYRPLVGRGSYFEDHATALTDLTGRWAPAAQNNSLHNRVWDADLRVMREWAYSDARRVIPTHYGATEVFEAERINRFQPGYPNSATEGNGAADSGWTKDGAHAADITLALASGAFGHDDVPHALRVTTTYGATRTRSLIASSLWDSGDPNYQGYAFTGSGTATLSIWLKGRVSRTTTLKFEQVGGNSDAVNLYDLDLSEWTKVSLAVASSDWTSALPKVTLDLSTGGTTAGDVDLLVGPCTVLNPSGSQCRHPEWTPSGTTVSGSYTQITSYQFPRAGGVFCSFYVPEGAEYSVAGLLGTTAGAGALQLLSNGATMRWFNQNSASQTASVSLVAGAINTVAVTWDTKGQVRLYCNGAQVGSAAYVEIDVAAATTTMLPGYAGGTGAWPLQPLTWRIDRRAWSADQVAQIDASLRDPVANALAVMARGRKFRIRQIPNTPRLQAGGTVWVGNLVIEEHEYDNNFADITSAEAY